MSDTCEVEDDPSNPYIDCSVACVGESSETGNSAGTFFDESLSAAIEAIAEATRLSGQCDAQLPDTNPVDSEVPDQMDPLQCTFANETVDQQQEQSTDEYLSPSHIDPSDIFSSVGLAYCVDQSQENCTLTQINTTSLIRTCHLPIQSLPNSPYLARMPSNWRQTLRPVFEKGLIDRLWAQGQLGAGSPQSLLLSMWFIISRHFGVGCRTEHAKLVYGNFSIGLDQVGTAKQVHFFRDPKTRVFAGFLSPHDSQPNQVIDMQPDHPDRCPVRLFEAFLSHRPKSAASANSPFYLQPERTGHSCAASRDEAVGSRPLAWYSPYALGKNRIGAMLNTALQSIGIPIGHLTNLSRFCDALATAAMAPDTGEDGVRLAELTVQAAECKQPEQQETVDALAACVSRVIDLAATPDSAIYQQLWKACARALPRPKPRRRRVTTVRSASTLSASTSVGERSSTLNTVNTENSYTLDQTRPQSAMATPMHNGTTEENHLDPYPISYYAGMKTPPHVTNCDLENDEFHLKNDIMCTFENQSEVVTHQLLAQMFQDTSANLLTMESPSSSRSPSCTTSPTTIEASCRSSAASYSYPSTMILVPINSDGCAASTSGQMNNTAGRLAGVDQLLSSPGAVNMETSSTKGMSAVGTRIVYFTTSALTPKCENLPTNSILPRLVVGHTPSVYPASTTITTNSKSTSMSSTSGISTIGEADVHIDLRKSAAPAGGSLGRPAKLELRELLDLVLASARTPKAAVGDCSTGGNSGGASASGSSLTVAATSGLLRPPVGLVTQLLWRARALDDRGPWILTFSMWWLMQHYFGVGSRMHHVRLRWGHLRLVSGLLDPVTDLPCEAVEYVGPAEFTTVKACAVLERAIADGDAAEATRLVRRVYPSSGWAEAEINVAAALSTEPVHQRPNVRPLITKGLDGLPIRPGPDFVALYKTFARRRQQPSLLADAPFYVQPLNLQNPQSSYNNLDAAWFSVGALGKNRIGALMRNIVDKVVRPNLPRVAEAATNAARSACIAAASRAAMALPLTSELCPSPRHDQDDYLASREWLLNKLSCLLGLCTKSVYAPLTDSQASPQTLAGRTVVRREREIHRPQVVGSKPASEGQAQIVLLADGSDRGGSYRIGSTAILNGGDVKPALIADISMTANEQQGEAQANSVILLPCSAVLTVASPTSSGLQLNSVAPVVDAHGQQPRLVQQRLLLHPAATLTSSHTSVLSRNTCQLEQQQCPQKQMSSDTRLPVVLEASLVNNGGAGQFAYLNQTPGANSVCATEVKLLLLPSNAKSSADTVSLVSHGLSAPSLEQASGSSTSAAATTPILPSPVIIPTAGIRPFSAANLHVLTDGVTVATSAPGATAPLAMATTSVPSTHVTSTTYSGLPLPGLKVEQLSPGCGVGHPVSSTIGTTNNTTTAAGESHVRRTTVYCRQTDLAGTLTNQVTPTGYRAQLPVAQLSASPLTSGTNSSAMPYHRIGPQTTSMDYSLHQLSADNSISQTGASIFTAVYNPTTGVYALTPAANLVALQPIAPAAPQLTPALSDERLLSATGLASVKQATPVAVISPVGGSSSCSSDGTSTGPNEKSTKAVAVFRSDPGNCYPQCSAQVFHSGLSNSAVSQSEQQQRQSSVDLRAEEEEEEPLRLLSLQSVIDSATAFQCNDFPAYVEQLFRSGVLGASRPWCLNFTAWFINTLAFGVENRTDHVNLRWGDFSIGRTADGRTEYLHFFNRVSRKAFWLAAAPQSPHSLGLDSGVGGADADGSGCRIRCPCPVAIFKALRDRRPPSCLHPCSKFYLQPRSLSKTSDDTPAAPVGTAKAKSTTESISLPSADKLVSPSSHRGGGSDVTHSDWFTEHAWGKNKLGGLFAEAARLARLPTIWLRKHRSRNIFPGGCGSSCLITVDDPAVSSSGNSDGSSGGKRKAAERNGSCDQQNLCNRAEAGVKRQRKRKKNTDDDDDDDSNNNNKGKQGEPVDSTIVMVKEVEASLSSTELPPTSGFYSSSSVVDAGELLQLPSSLTIIPSG